MGADPLAHGVAMVTGKAWFSVRKEQKPRGREQWIEGTRIEPGTRVLLVDDVISTGGSTEIAFDRVTRRAPWSPASSRWSTAATWPPDCSPHATSRSSRWSPTAISGIEPVKAV